ncbi:phosphatase PAP2 family protein [Streptomyces coeruleorubidus]|uniref:phosphatase PAP2 family protein n=1 Tax=Streptomyces coeruleorubidus TaxID=116188 RepID=UPI0038115967
MPGPRRLPALSRHTVGAARRWCRHATRRARPTRPPSPPGHTTAAVAFTTTVAPAWPLAGALCTVSAAMVAIERVQNGAHYPSDVTAGAAIGPASAWLTRRAPHLILRHWL